MPHAGGGLVVHGDSGAGGVEEPVGVFVIGEVGGVEEADFAEDIAVDQQAGGGRVGDGARGVEGRAVGLILAEVDVAIAVAGMEFSAGGPEGGGRGGIVDAGADELAGKFVEGADELSEQVGLEEDIVIDEQDEGAIVGEGSADALVVAFGGAVIG